MKHLLITLAWVAIATLGWANQPENSTLFNTFYQHEMLPIELELDFDAISESVETDEKSDAVFKYQNANGQWEEWSVNVKVRGRFRRRVCDYPPLKIDFSKKDLQSQGLAPYDDLKLVTHCFDDPESKEAVIKEYLAYQMYNELSNQSFRAQLVEVIYKDISSRKRYKAYGILLEDVDELANRTQSIECEECYGLNASDLNAEEMVTLQLFQYMIGNTDWDVPMSRNLKIMQKQGQSGYWLAPYDFDFSGLVDASYAIPDVNYKQKNITDRIYLGQRPSADVWNAVKQRYLRKKEDLIDIVNSVETLRKSTRKNAINYLDAFFVELETDTVNFLNKEGQKVDPTIR
jgi:ribosomal protein L20A (L18A)